MLDGDGKQKVYQVLNPGGCPRDPALVVEVKSFFSSKYMP